jgi:hypothetical protein
MNIEFKRMQQLAGIKEITIGDPTKIYINDLKIGDKLKVKHVDEFIAFVFRVGQVWEIANIDEDREHYRLVNSNTQTSLGFSKRDIEELINSGTFEYAKESKTNEIKINNPTLIEFENLKVGDKLIVKHVGSNNWGIKYNVGDIWEIIDITEGWMLAMGHMFYKLEHVNGNKEIHSLYDNEMKEAVDSGVFGYYKKSKTNEAMILNPQNKSVIEDIILLDKKFINKISKTPYDSNQIGLLNKFYDEYERYGIEDALSVDYDGLREKLVKQPYKLLKQLYEELKSVMNKLPNAISEIQVTNPVIPPIVKFGNENIDKIIRQIIDYPNTTVYQPFKLNTNTDRESAYAVFNMLTQQDDIRRIIVVISFERDPDEDYHEAMEKISGKYVYYTIL